MIKKIQFLLIIAPLAFAACSAREKNANLGEQENVNSYLKINKNIESNIMYYSHKQCSSQGKCTRSLPQYKNSSAILSVYDPTFDEFYLGSRLLEVKDY
jgi:uncharacterized protein YcfL